MEARIGLAVVRIESLERFPPRLAADVSLWIVCGTTHARLCKPEGRLSEASFETPAAQLLDALRRLAEEQQQQPQPQPGTAAGGTLREPIARLLYEALAAINALAKQPWARARVLEALGAAQKIGGGVWLPRERANIDKLA